MLLELVKGVALLLALCFVHGVNVRLWRNRPNGGRVASGLLFGAICVVGMLSPLHLVPGVIIDARSVVLSMAALFGGPVVAAIAAAMAAAWRLSIGGAGTGIGVVVILWCTALGLAYRWGRGRGLVGIGPLALLAFGVLLHLSVLGLFQWLEAPTVEHINRHLALPYLLVFGPATAFLGWLLQDVEHHFTTERALADSAARLGAMAQAIPDVVLLIDDEGRYVEVLSSDESLLVAPAATLLGKRLDEVLPAAQARHFLEQIRNTLATRAPERFEYDMQTLGGLRHFEGRSQPLGTLVNGRPAVVFIARDQTERVQAEAALRESELRFRTLLRDIPSISVQGYLADGTTIYWNKASEALYGYTAEEALGKNLLDLIIPPDMHSGVQEAIRGMFATEVPIPASELQLQRKDGSKVDVFSSHAFVRVWGHPPEMFCIDVDITGRKAAEEQARYLAYYDALTRLPNRRLLVDRLQQVVAGSARTGLCAAVLFVDLDDFKSLNETRGHEVGDLLLVESARRLQASVRSQDTVARLGGDEFVIVLQNLSTDAPEAAALVRTLGEQILRQLRLPYLLAGQEHRLSASIGATLVHARHTPVDELLKQADLAMYRAKDAGRNTLRFFDPVMQEAINQRVALEAEMHEGLRAGQFVLFYQPQVDASGRITGAEVLIRWQHPAKGLVSPAVFIPLAEETGLILPLGQWVLETALRQQARWRADPQMAGLSLSVNVSARQFRQDAFVSTVLDQLRCSGANPVRIKLELTESLLLQDVEGVIATMQELRAHGLGFSLDDFGTGYSSLGYLKRLPLDQIKIDQGFVRDVMLDPKDAAIAHTIIMLAQEMGLAVIAEGVETPEHHQFLMQHGCRAFQGYLFGRPEPLQAFEQRVRDQEPAPPQS
jgi:diguanylate cyclase (GGDEF)-like protein/PAS domain S-box-containing protein